MVTPKKKWGQNFLSDKGVIEKIIDSVSPHRDDHILEIGAGCGALTKHLFSATPHIKAVEIDPECVSLLSSQYPQLIIEKKDIMNFDWHSLEKKHRIVGNIPYYISCELLILFCEHHEKIDDIHIMLQKEVGQRIASQAGESDFSRLSLLVSSYFHVEHLFDISSDCFRPKPKVTSSFMRLTKRDEPHFFDETIQNIAKKAFEKRRKTIRNSLSSLFTEEDFRKMNILSKKRAQELTHADYQTMSSYYKTICKKH